MKSRSLIFSVAVAALLVPTAAAVARPLHDATPDPRPSRHHPVSMVHSVDIGQTPEALQTAHKPYDSECRAHNRIQSWGYETCLQELHASAMTGGGGY